MAQRAVAHPGARFIDPTSLARIGNLELIARTVVDGFINGLHRSPYLGLSLDFAEHRAYMPGDDIRRVDWRLFARTDRYYVKEYEADTNANFAVLLDVSRSMGYGSHGITKLDYARYIAATLTYFSHRQRDRVGFVAFDDDVVEYVPPSARHLEVILHALDRLEPERAGSARGASAGDGSGRDGSALAGSPRDRPAGDGSGGSGSGRGEAGRLASLAAPLDKAVEGFRRRGILVVVSDFYEEPEQAVAAVRQLRGRGSDIIVFHVLDPAELDLPFDRAATFEDLESGARIPVVPDELRAQYRELIEAHTAELGRLFAEERIDYTLVNTATPLDHVLFGYLAAREKLARVR